MVFVANERMCRHFLVKRPLVLHNTDFIVIWALEYCNFGRELLQRYYVQNSGLRRRIYLQVLRLAR